MNAKIFFIALALNLISLSVSTGTSTPKTGNDGTDASNSISNPDKPKDDTMPWANAIQNVSYKCQEHDSDDDGKTHHHHFKRFINRKRRMLFCFCGKMILIISYLCSLISFYLQYLPQ